MLTITIHGNIGVYQNPVVKINASLGKAGTFNIKLPPNKSSSFFDLDIIIVFCLCQLFPMSAKYYVVFFPSLQDKVLFPVAH